MIGAVEGAAVPPGVESDEVEGGGAGGVVEVGLGKAAVAGSAQAGGVGGLADGALDPGPQCVVALPGAILLLSAGGADGLGELTGVEAEPAALS